LLVVTGDESLSTEKALFPIMVNGPSGFEPSKLENVRRKMRLGNKVLSSQ
jgi:hypothetical protein